MIVGHTQSLAGTGNGVNTSFCGRNSVDANIESSACRFGTCMIAKVQGSVALYLFTDQCPHSQDSTSGTICDPWLQYAVHWYIQHMSMVHADALGEKEPGKRGGGLTGVRYR